MLHRTDAIESVELPEGGEKPLRARLKRHKVTKPRPLGRRQASRHVSIFHLTQTVSIRDGCILAEIDTEVKPIKDNACHGDPQKKYRPSDVRRT